MSKNLLYHRVKPANCQYATNYQSCHKATCIICVRSITPNGSFQTSLVMAKLPVTSVNGMNIPRLEINGALNTTRFCHYVQKSLIQEASRIESWTEGSNVIH